MNILEFTQYDADRFANTWVDDGIYQRQLIKAYGIRINIIVLGEVGDTCKPKFLQC